MSKVKYIQDYRNEDGVEYYEVYGAREICEEKTDYYAPYSPKYNEHKTELLIYIYGEWKWEDAEELEPYYQ